MAGARAAYVGPGLHLSPHRNAAATVALAFDAPFTLSLGGAPPARRAVALIPPNTRHHLVAGGPMAFVYLDAVSDDVGALDLRGVRARLAARAVSRWNVVTLCEALRLTTRAPRDRRIADAVLRLDARPGDFPRLATLASTQALSPSRFQALFRREVGLSFRRYRLWRRMAVVMRALGGGLSLTDAALEAGFSSSAHLSASFRDMFGLAPSTLVALGARVESLPPFTS